MDPIYVLMLCLQGSTNGLPLDIAHLPVEEYERVWREEPSFVRKFLDGTLCGEYPENGLDLLLRAGAIDALFPEIAAMKNLGDDNARHKDVWAHTKSVVAGVPNKLELRWGALMHDIGKTRTRKFVGNKVTFHNHDVVGSQMLDKMQLRLGLFNNDVALFDTVQMLVLNHLRPAAIASDCSDTGARRLLSDIGGMQNFEKLMLLSRADLTTKNDKKRAKCVARADYLEKRVREVYADDNRPKLPKYVMGSILSQSGRNPGQWLNDLRNRLELDMRNGTLPSDKDAKFYVTHGLWVINNIK